MTRQDTLSSRKPACEACGKRLAELRYTRRGEATEFCSEACRDGEEAAAARAARRKPKERRGEK
ncbi:MAG: hypothetical protein P4L00_13255 [Candidatus Acidoferrales bacterium]|nr:hypothetical protein [Candidatus Acidoferrales bacterium]